MRPNVLLLMIFAPCLMGCTAFPAGGSDTSGSDRSPQARLAPVTAPLISADGAATGLVTLRQGPQGLLFVIDGQNWPQGWHGVHLHAVGSCEVPAFTSAGGHVNHPENARPHGLLNWDGGPDYGDLQNVYAHADGTARAEVYVPTMSATMGDHDGLSLVVHAGPDDHQSQPIGGAGARIACAVLENGSLAAPD